jgi:hypothetical protein
MSLLTCRARSARIGPASATSAEARAVPAVRPGSGPLLRSGPAAAACLMTVLALAGCGAAGHPAARPGAAARQADNADHFGGYPSFLPRSTLNYHSDTVLTGTVQRPALTNEGDGVEVRTPRWSVLVTVTGPQVPGEGLPYQAPSTTCTWVVTMSDATGPVPISVTDFTSIDDLDNVYRPTFVPGQPRPPRMLRPGVRVSFELRAAEATGEGLMRWAPDGRNIVAKWDFVVEND